MSQDLNNFPSTLYSNACTTHQVFAYLRNSLPKDSKHTKPLEKEWKMKGVEVVVFVAILSLFAGRSTARFGDCFAKCYGPCCYTPFDSIYCSTKCVTQCAGAAASYAFPTAFHKPTTAYNFCKLGCATSLCTNFSTKNDPGSYLFWLNYKFDVSFPFEILFLYSFVFLRIIYACACLLTFLRNTFELSIRFKK